MQLFDVRRKLRVAKDGEAVSEEGRASEWLGGDVGEVVSGGVFDEEDSFALLGEVDHGVLGSDPFQFGRDALAAGAVDEDAGVGVDGGRSSGCEAKPTEEVSEFDYGFCALNRLAQLCSARGVAGIGGQVTRDHEAAATVGGAGVLESEATVGPAIGPVVSE